MGVDLARGRLPNGETREALRLWEAVLRGRSSIVDWFDADGRRFILALPHASHDRDPRGLTERECQVATHVGAGESSKLVAYRLGVSRSRVSELLASGDATARRSDHAASSSSRWNTSGRKASKL